MGHIQGVADRIRDRLQALGYWKQGRPDVRRFCEERGYTTQYVYGWLNGRKPSLPYLTRLATDLSVTVEWMALGGGAGQEQPKRRRVSAFPAPELVREPPPHRPPEGERGRGERGKVIEHPLSRVGSLVEQLAKSEEDLRATVRAWRDSEERFRKIFEDGPLGIVIFDPTALVFVGVNQRFAGMLGYAPEEMVGRYVLDFTQAGDVAEGVESISGILSGREPFASRESRYVKKSGEVIWGHVTSVIVRDDAGAALYGVGMVQDVTERRRAEERLQSLFSGVPTGLYRCAPEGPLLDANPAMVQILGCEDRETLLATNARDFYVDLEDRRRWEDALRRDHVVRGFETRLRRRDGTLIWVRDSARAIRDGEGRLVAWEGALEDITARKRAEEATKALAQVGRELAESLDLARTTDRIVTAVLGLLGANRSVLFRLDHATGALVCVAAAGAGDPAEWIGKTLPAGVGTSGRAVAEAGPVWSSDLLTDPGLIVPDWVRERIRIEGYRSALSIPLTAGGEVLGALAVGHVGGRAYHEEDLALLSAFADQAALALQNARLYEETKQGRREAEVLTDLAGTINASLDLGTVLQQVTEGAKELCRSDLARIALPKPSSDAMVITHWSAARYDRYDTVPIEAGKGTGGQVLATGRPFRTDDHVADPRFSKDSLAMARIEGIVAEMVVPIRTGSRVEGLLYVSNRSDRPFTDRDEAILLRLADHAAIAIRNARLFEEAERRRRAAQSLAEVGRLVSQSLDPVEVGQRIADCVRALLGTRLASLMRVDPVSGDLRVVASSGDTVPALVRGSVVPRGANVVGAAVRARRPVTTADLAADPSITVTPDTRALFAAAADRAVLAVPLMVKDRVIGALSVRDRSGRAFDVEEVQLAQAFADQAALALENARMYAELQAQRDRLLARSAEEAVT